MWTRLWTALNQPVGVWFLTSVVVGIFSFAFSRYQRFSKERTRKAEIRERLNLEIGTRIAEGLTALRLDQARLLKGRPYWAMQMYNQALHYLDNRVTYLTDDKKTATLDFSVYPEYRQRGFRSLTYELGAVAKDIVPALQVARTDYNRLVDIADQAENQTAPDTAIALDAAKTSIQTLEKLQSNSFWRPPQ
jgi:hypothetical protein